MASSHSKREVFSEKSGSPHRRLLSVRLILIALLLLTVAGISSSIYLYFQYVAASQTKDYELPSDETPTLAIVSDNIKLKDQIFFARAQNGDKVLIYTKTGKAILYRPSTNKIIEVGPVNVAENTQQATSTASTVRVALYNGTTTTGLTRTAEAAFLQLSSLNVEVVAKENASTSAYQEGDRGRFLYLILLS